MVKILLRNKPTKWYITRNGKRHLTNGAKSYLSYKLRKYYSTNKKISSIQRRKKVKSTDKIRMWMKGKSDGRITKSHQPIYIEAYIEGTYGEYDNMYRRLYSELERVFGTRQVDYMEFGIEKVEDIKNYSNRPMAIRYRYRERGHWIYIV